MASLQDPSTAPSEPLIDEGARTCAQGSGGSICRWVYDVTGSQTAADITMWVIEKPLKIALVAGLAWFAIWLGRRAIHGFIVKLPAQVRRVGLSPDESLAAQHRQQQRAQSVEQLLTSGLKFVVWFVAAVMILEIIGINIGPLIVSAGVVALAVSLGAQTLIKDLIGGITIILDDRLAVGDEVDLADSSGKVGATGRVENLGLSSTTIRDDTGEIWHVPNGDIRWVGNLSQLWSRIPVDVRIAYGTDIAAAKETLARAVAEVVEDPRYADGVIEPPHDPFVRLLAEDAAVIRCSVRVRRSRHDAVKAALLEAVAQALPEADVGPALPRQVVVVADHRRRSAA